MKGKILFLHIFMISFLGFSAYVNSLNGELVWDDAFNIRYDTNIKDLHNLPNLFRERVEVGEEKVYSSFFRPLQAFTYMLNYSFSKLDVRAYHFTNIIIHVLTALCLYWLVFILFGDSLISLLTAIFFIVHPVQTETVAYISCRGDSMSSLFMLLTLIFYIKQVFSKNINFFLLMVLFYVSALLSKENSIILPFLLVAYHYVFKQKIRLKIFLPVSAIACLYVILRLSILKSSVTSSGILFERIPGFFAAISNYIRLLIFPFNLHMDYGVKLFSLADPSVFFGIITSVFLLFYAFKKVKDNKLLSFSIIWFFTALLPVSNIYPLPFYMAEHYLYFPSIGFFVILSAWLTRFYNSERTRVLAAVIIVSLPAIYFCMTVRQNGYWKNSMVSYMRTLQFNPNSWDAYFNLGNIYFRGDHTGASKNPDKNNDELCPECEVSRINVDSMDSVVGDKEKAFAMYKKAAELFPNHWRAYNNLGIIYSSMGNNQAAIAAFNQVIRIKPDFVKAYNNLGIAYYLVGDTGRALAAFNKALEIDPYFSDAYNNLGSLYNSIGEKDKSIATYRKLIEIEPNYAMAYYNLGIVYASINKNQDAIKAFDKAIKINPGYADAHLNLAAIYYTQKRYKSAAEHYLKAVELGSKVNPEFERIMRDMTIEDRE